MRKICLSFVILCALAACASPAPQKYLIILQAGTESHEGTARTVHALLYAQELKDSGYDVTLVFDGAGTEWAKALRDPENKLHGAYQKLREAGVTQIICDYCAGAFKVKEDLKDEDVPLVGDFKGHPSIVKYIKQGYQLVVL